MRNPGDSSGSRFRDEPDSRFWKMNRSLPVDSWLAPFDIRQSLAHARALGRLGILDPGEEASLIAGLETVRDEVETGEFLYRDLDEDVHMAVERRLGELVGPLAGKLHTARSRNDQVATDLAMAVIDATRRIDDAITGLMEAVLGCAVEHRDWVMPGYTHLQRAQPVYLGHHLMAYFWMFERDRERFAQVRSQASSLPLGSGALAGVNWELDLEQIAAELGFERISSNSIDGASNRDFVLDFLSAAAIASTHLSRLGSEIVIWSSAEFRFCSLAEGFTSGSSIMPQKQNPDSAEILRAKSPGQAAGFSAMAGVLHALPLTYNKDLQEDKAPVRDAIALSIESFEMAKGMIEGLSFDRNRLEEAAGDEMIGATELADYLTSRGLPFREAHGIVGRMVSDCLESGMSLSELDREALAGYSELFDTGLDNLIGATRSIESKRGPGATSTSSLEAQFELARRALRSPE